MDKIEKIKKLAKTIEFDFNDVELQKIVDEFDQIEKSLEFIKTIDVENIEATNFVHEMCDESILVDETVVEYNPKEVFSNCELNSNHYLEIKNEK